jgi:hypothetical protein
MASVRKRIVFFIGGFHPLGPALYHPVFKSEAAKQAALAGYKLAVSERGNEGQMVSRWQVIYEDAQGPVQTDYVSLRWDDIIRHQWPRGWLWGLQALYDAYWIPFKRGHLFKLYPLRPPTAITFLIPLLLPLLSGVFGAIVGAALALFGAEFLAQLGAPESPWIHTALGLAGFVGTVAAMHWRYLRLRAYWLLRIYRFIGARSRQPIKALDQRERDFAERIQAASAAGEHDEVLVVGHSLGVNLGVAALAHCVQMDPNGAEISFLSLGQSLPLVTHLRGSQTFVSQLVQVAHSHRVQWVDVTAPHDGSCFAFVDPVAAAGASQRDPAAPSPKMVNARFARLFSPAAYRKVCRDRFEIHFQYVRAGQKLGDYDYFAITCGPQTLSDRYADRPSAVAEPYRLFKRRFT